MPEVGGENWGSEGGEERKLLRMEVVVPDGVVAAGRLVVCRAAFGASRSDEAIASTQENPGWKGFPPGFSWVDAIADDRFPPEEDEVFEEEDVLRDIAAPLAPGKSRCTSSSAPDVSVSEKEPVSARGSG